MSASAISPAQAELISSLSQDDIPIKLRCAICSRLAVNAFRLPCCDQSICETCQSSLPSTCPVCEHSPVASEDCKPHKSLRTTIRVFLRTEEKKREALRLKEVKDTPPATPVEREPVAPPTLLSPTARTAPIPNNAISGEVNSESPPTAYLAAPAPVNPEDIAQLQEEQKDIPQPSIEEIAPGQRSILDADANISGDARARDEEGDKDVTERNTSGQPAEGVSQTPAFGTGLSLDGGNAAGFLGGMGFGGDMNQMQMMMAMQNSMPPNAFNNFPMMGMPGMNMDPMMQSMFMNGGFGAGMGMNSMNGMGMGMGGFEGGLGGGFNNGWNGQQSWNIGPDNFNHPNATGMGPGDYGSNNSGYTPHAAGYNQGNYGRGSHYNDYQNNSFSYRGRGRGRGGYNRGGYGFGSHEAFSQQQSQQFGSGNQSNGSIGETGSIPTGPKSDATPAGNVDEFGREIRPASAANETPAESEMLKDETTLEPGAAVNDNEAQTNTDRPSADVEIPPADNITPKPIQTLDEVQAHYAQTSNLNGYHNNQHLGRGGFYNGAGGMHPPVKPVDIPINAPTGPKAMREGLPNTSIAHLRARGLVPGPANSMANGSTSVAPEPSEKDQKEKARSRSPSRDRSRSRSRDRRRSRSTERHHSRRHRHRSTSGSEDEKETERRRQRRRDRRRRREEEGEERDDTGSGEKAVDEGRGDVEQHRSRSASPSGSKRSSHRSRRDKDKYRERERDSDREHRSSHKHRSSHHSYRDDKSRSRDRDRDRDRDRERRHRHSRHGSEVPEDKYEKAESSVPPTPIESVNPARRPSLVSNGTNGIEIKGASNRRKDPSDEIVIPTGPRSSRERQNDKESATSRSRDDEHRSSRHRDLARDKETDRLMEKERPKSTPSTVPAITNPHEEEREARNRERLLKEAQRMAGLSGLAASSRKRSRDDGADVGGVKGKKKGRRGGGVEESDEARIARLEAERESARW